MTMDNRSPQADDLLAPLLDGKTRSCFSMTEPAVASSDATNIAKKIERDGDHYVVNGRKWFASNAYHPDLAFYILMGRSSDDAPVHLRHSQLLIDADAPGIKRLGYLPVLGYSDLPRGHGEVLFENVRVPDYARMRVLGIADGPDEVHNRTIAKLELQRFEQDAGN